MHKIGIVRVLAGLMIALTICSSGTYADQGEALMKAASGGDLKQAQDRLKV